MEINEFARGVRDILENKKTELSERIIKNIPNGTSVKNFRVLRNGFIRVYGGDLEGIFRTLSRTKMYVDYQYIAKGEREISKKFPINFPISKAREEFYPMNIFSEKITTEDFEISKMNKEIIVKGKDLDLLFRLICGLFPYANTTKIKEYGVKIEFEKNENKKLGKVIVSILLDGVQYAKKSNIFKL